MVAITKACRRLRSWRLSDCDMYVTLEPCQMCMGAAVNARIRKVYVGAKSTTDLNWQTETEFADNPECREILIEFFKQKRYTKSV
jgi:tRNA(adenine34) deaminase